MTNTFQQRAQVRKLIYAALILGLFTVSLIHRKMPVYGLDQKAFDLQLREAAHGEVNLPSSVVRQVLIGSRGLAVSLLWHAAMTAQDKQNWNEVQLLVDSITMLQPYFISPWRYQGWNLAFNVSVMCDRPADRYYYIAHGMSLLAEGDRRNQGAEIEGKTRFPGNPELRRDIGDCYQLKIGVSDDKYVMRSLLDLSCMDPRERDFENLGEGERREKLRTFCQKHPMLVRRLIEQVHLNDDERDGYRILKFIKDNKDVPSRFKPVESAEQKVSVLKKIEEQFPVLPRPEGDWPNPNNVELTHEPINPYLMSRTWYQYSLKPLPPPRNFFDITREEFPKNLDQTQYREAGANPFFFRTNHCRAQEFMAESFEGEGWFDEPWNVSEYLRLDEEDAPRTGALSPPSQARAVFIGAKKEYQVKDIWIKAANMFKETGLFCGLYFDPDLRRKFQIQAAKFRDKFGIKPEVMVPKLEEPTFTPEDETNRFAHEALRSQHEGNGVTNFEGHLYTCDAKGTSAAVRASKYFYRAELLRTSHSWYRAIEQYELAQPIWLYVLLQKPRFAKVLTNQEETYTAQLMYCSIVQGVKYRTFQDVLLGVSELAPFWNGFPPPWSSIPSRKFRKLLGEKEWHTSLPDPGKSPLFSDPKKNEKMSFALLELAPSWPFIPIPWASTNPARPAWSLKVKTRAVGSGGESEFRPLLSEADRLKVMGPDRQSKIRTTRGLFDTTQYYSGPANAPEKYVEKLKETLVGLSYGTSLSPRVPFPYEPALMLTRAPLGIQPPPLHWRDLIEERSIAAVRSRLQIQKPKY